MVNRDSILLPYAQRIEVIILEKLEIRKLYYQKLVRLLKNFGWKYRIILQMSSWMNFK